MSLSFDKPVLERMRAYAANTRLQDQIAYHDRTKERASSIAHVLRIFGLSIFVATILAGGLKLALHGPDVLSLLAGVLPAFAYAFYGIRNQAEFEIVSSRSERMVAKLARHRDSIKALTGDDLTVDTLGLEICQAAAVMRHDAADWASIFEVKETEEN